MAEKILDVITRTSVERRVELSRGEKITGEVDLFPGEYCPLITPYEYKRLTRVLEYPYECLVRISRLVKGQQGMTREFVYEEVIAKSLSPVSFEVPEDGEYLIEVELREMRKGTVGAVRISLMREEKLNTTWLGPFFNRKGSSSRT